MVATMIASPVTGDAEGRRTPSKFAALLLIVIAGHTALEAARDALLLTGPGPRALGWVYAAIALCALPAAALVGRASERFGPHRALVGVLTTAALLAVALFVAPATYAVSMAVYVLSGLVGSIAVPQFWNVAGQVLTVAQGRRLFGPIAAAGVVGGVLGSGIAAGALLVLPVRALLLVSASLFAIAVGALLRIWEARGTSRGPSRERAAAGESVRALYAEPLLTRIALSVMASTATLLVLDYCFKSAVARSIPAGHLGPFLARYYLALNGLSLAVQLFLGSAVVRRLGVTRALVLTPALLILSAVGVLAGGGGLGPVLVMKAIDGGLRFSVHRITGELVYLPLPARVRQHQKPFIDGALARASQTLTGVALLAGGARFLSPYAVAGAVVVLGACWLAATVAMRRPYLAMLRGAIASGSLDTQDSPGPLDLESAQLLVQHLGSGDPLEVVGAMNALCRRGHVGFVPALVLLHTDEEVLAQALEHFGASGRNDWIPMARRLLRDAREPVRMAAARALLMHGAVDLASLERDAGPRVRGYAAVWAAAAHDSENVTDRPAIAAVLHEPGEEGAAARLGMLAAVADAPKTPGLGRLVAAIWGASDGSTEQTVLLARAAARQHDALLVPRLVDRLGSRDAREPVRSALVAFGDDALDALWWALCDTSRPRNVRLHIPKTIARFGTRAAAEHLLENVESEQDGLVRYKSIRALEMLVSQRHVAVDRARIERLAFQALERHFRLLGLRIALEEGAPAAGSGTAARLLVGLIEDKLRQSLERAFRLIAIAQPREDMSRLRLACLSDDPYTRATGGELLDSLLRRRDQQALRALVRIVTDDLSRAERVGQATSLLPDILPAGRNDAIAILSRDADVTLSMLARAWIEKTNRGSPEGRASVDAGER